MHITSRTTATRDNTRHPRDTQARIEAHLWQQEFREPTPDVDRKMIRQIRSLSWVDISAASLMVSPQPSDSGGDDSDDDYDDLDLVTKVLADQKRVVASSGDKTEMCSTANMSALLGANIALSEVAGAGNSNTVEVRKQKRRGGGGGRSGGEEEVSLDDRKDTTYASGEIASGGIADDESNVRTPDGAGSGELVIVSRGTLTDINADLLQPALNDGGGGQMGSAESSIGVEEFASYESYDPDLFLRIMGPGQPRLSVEDPEKVICTVWL